MSETSDTADVEVTPVQPPFFHILILSGGKSGLLVDAYERQHAWLDNRTGQQSSVSMFINPLVRGPLFDELLASREISASEQSREWALRVERFGGSSQAAQSRAEFEAALALKIDASELPCIFVVVGGSLISEDGYEHCSTLHLDSAWLGSDDNVNRVLSFLGEEFESLTIQEACFGIGHSQPELTKVARDRLQILRKRLQLKLGAAQPKARSRRRTNSEKCADLRLYEDWKSSGQTKAEFARASSMDVDKARMAIERGRKQTARRSTS